MNTFVKYISLDSYPIYLLHESKFKTVRIMCFFRRKLDEKATLAALLPRVLMRGTNQLTRKAYIEQALENNYGSRLKATTRKIGEEHIIEFSLNMPCRKYLTNPNNDVYSEGINILKQILIQPFTRDGVFDKAYVEQEKAVLSREIRSVYNNKREWALKRCIEISCEGEPFEISALGNIEQLEKIDNKQLYNFYQYLLQESYFSIYIIGNIEKEEIIPQLHKICFKRKYHPNTFNNNAFRKRYNTKEVIEYDDIKQGKLFVCLRCNIEGFVNSLSSFLVYSSILGSGSTSKLFNVLRKKYSLAYHVATYADEHKRIILIEAGIDPSNYSKTVMLIKEAMNSMKNGNITEGELRVSVVKLINSLRYAQDFGLGSVYFHLGQVLLDIELSLAQFIERLCQVSIADIAEMAQNISLDTIYFLSPKEGYSGSSH